MICDHLCNSSCPPPVSVSPNPSYFLHSSPSLSVCVGQLSGLLPVKLHERTGGSTFLLNIALHSGDSLPCLWLPLPALCFFCPFLHCSVQLELWATLLSEAFFSLFAAFLCRAITGRMLCFLCWNASSHALFCTSWHKLSFHTLL